MKASDSTDARAGALMSDAPSAATTIQVSVNATKRVPRECLRDNPAAELSIIHTFQPANPRVVIDKCHVFLWVPNGVKLWPTRSTNLVAEAILKIR
jgi:hypothetical protein